MSNTKIIAEPSEPPLSTAGELHERGRHLGLAIEALRTKVRNREATGWFAYQHEMARDPEQRPS